MILSQTDLVTVISPQSKGEGETALGPTGIGGVSAKDLWRKKKLNFRHLAEISAN